MRVNWLNGGDRSKAMRAPIAYLIIFRFAYIFTFIQDEILNMSLNCS